MVIHEPTTGITIRTELKPGDIGHVANRHGEIYAKEHGFGIAFEAYVAEGLAEFYRNYDPLRDRVWVCEQGSVRIGFLLLMHRPENTAQLRYFYLEPEYRGIGLGKKLMTLFMEFFSHCGYHSAYLWTTGELDAAAALYKRFGFVLTDEKPSGMFGKQLAEQRYEYHPAG